MNRLTTTLIQPRKSSYLLWSVLGSTVASPVAVLCQDKKEDPDELLHKVFDETDKGPTKWGLGSGQFFGGDIANGIGGKIYSYDNSETTIPTQITYGFGAGFCSGYALKKVGRVAAVVIGLGFVSLQTLAYYGYLNINHGRIAKDVEALLDLNHDGVSDAKDRVLAFNKLMKVLQYQLPSGSGFTMGFLGGVRAG